jgi:hypothetical protein
MAKNGVQLCAGPTAQFSTITMHLNGSLLRMLSLGNGTISGNLFSV